jgi:hypothetical protein
MSTLFEEPLDFLSAALKLSIVTSEQPGFLLAVPEPKLCKQLLLVSCPVDRKSEHLKCDASYAQKLGPLDEVSQVTPCLKKNPIARNF